MMRPDYTRDRIAAQANVASLWPSVLLASETRAGVAEPQPIAGRILDGTPVNC
jgi:hypothetical protein